MRPLIDVTEGYKIGAPQAMPTPPLLKHLASSFSASSGIIGTSYSSDASSLRSTYTNPALSTCNIFLSSSDALSAAKASVQQEQQRERLEREQIALLNSLKPRRDLMCLADVVDVDVDRERETERERLALRSTLPSDDSTRPDNYHLHIASRPAQPTTPEEEPYRPERGRKRHTVEEDEGEATETEDMEDADMEMDVVGQENGVSHRPIRGIRRTAGVQPIPTSRPLPVTRSRPLRPTQSAPVGTLQRPAGGASAEMGMDLEGGLSAWVGRTDF